jgi:hypothetical protein
MRLLIGFNMQRDFFDPPWEETNVILIDESVLRQAEGRLYACDACDPGGDVVPLLITFWTD